MHLRRLITPHGRNGFSGKDLLAVLAGISVLGILQIAALGNGTGKSRLSTCIANFEQLTLAWSLYAEDNNAKLVWNPDGSDAGKTSIKPAWAAGSLSYSAGNADNTNTEYLVNYGSPAGKWGGLLGPYLKRNSAVFRCPEDQSSVTLAGQPVPRARSVSMNGFMNGVRAVGGPDSWSSPLFKMFRKTSDVISLKPASALVFIDESENSINDEVWSIDMPHCIDVNGAVTPGTFAYIDLPASRHDRGAVLSFADTHVEHWKWQDPRSSPALKPGDIFQVNTPSANNADIARLAQSISTR